MKFEVEVISDGRIIVFGSDNTVTITTDNELGPILRRLAEGKPARKREYPKGTRKRRKTVEAPPECDRPEEA